MQVVWRKAACKVASTRAHSMSNEGVKCCSRARAPRVLVLLSVFKRRPVVNKMALLDLYHNELEREMGETRDGERWGTALLKPCQTCTTCTRWASGYCALVHRDRPAPPPASSMAWWSRMAK